MWNIQVVSIQLNSEVQGSFIKCSQLRVDSMMPVYKGMPYIDVSTDTREVASLITHTMPVNMPEICCFSLRTRALLRRQSGCIQIIIIARSTRDCTSWIINSSVAVFGRSSYDLVSDLGSWMCNLWHYEVPNVASFWVRRVMSSTNKANHLW